MSQTHSESKANDDRADAWFNATLYLKDVDLQRELFSVSGFFNIYWKTSDEYIDLNINDDEEKLNSLQLALKQLQTGQRLDLLPLMKASDNADFLQIMDKTPVIANNGFQWFFFNSATQPQITRFIMQYYPDYNKSRLEIMFTADLAETFELEDFPFDAQFLNIKLKLKVFKYKFFSGVEAPKNFLDGVKLVENKGVLEYHHERPLSVVILQPIDKEWHLLKPWMDFRINKNTLFCLIRLRVRRKAHGYVWNNIIPLILITGLSFIYIAIESQANQLAFIVTLLLTIAAGRSELVPEMPRYAGATKIDYFVLIAYVIFAIEMFGVAAIGDGNHCGTYNWGESDESCVAEVVVFVICVSIWLMGICYVFVNRFEGCTELCSDFGRGIKQFFIDCCKCGDQDEFWEERSDKEFASWKVEQIIDDHETVDERYMFGSDQPPIERGQQITYTI